MNKTEKIKKHWDERADQYGESWSATLGEKHLRALEIKVMNRLIKKYRPRNVLDVGCGNGFAIKIFARTFPKVSFLGIDYSARMLQYADTLPIDANCSFMLADVTSPASLPEGPFDLIITQRCIQNIPTYDEQRKAIMNLLDKKSANGKLLLMECSKDGVLQLNRMRARFGKEPISGIEPWHNNFFRDHWLMEDFNARVLYFSSTYMFLAKVLDGRLARVAAELPAVGRFGYDRVYVIE